MAVKKYVKKIARKVRGKAIKRYFKKGYKPKMGRIMKDVAYLKSVLNPEKKIFQINNTDTFIGQCQVNASAYYCQDITPSMAQGISDNTRNGNSIRVSTAYFKFQAHGQSGTIGNAIKLRVMLVQVVGTPIASAATALVPLMYKPNSFITGGTIYDYNSDRREDTYKQFRIVASRNINLRPNQHSGQLSHQTVGMPIKFKSHHVKFTANGSNAVSDGQLCLVILADAGNTSTTTASTLVGTPFVATNSAAIVQQDLTFWYYDN